MSDIKQKKNTKNITATHESLCKKAYDTLKEKLAYINDESSLKKIEEAYILLKKRI